MSPSTGCYLVQGFRQLSLFRAFFHRPEMLSPSGSAREALRGFREFWGLGGKKEIYRRDLCGVRTAFAMGNSIPPKVLCVLPEVRTRMDAINEQQTTNTNTMGAGGFLTGYILSLSPVPAGWFLQKSAPLIFFAQLSGSTLPLFFARGVSGKPT